MISSLYNLTGTLVLRDASGSVVQSDDTVIGHYTIPDLSFNEGYATLASSESLLDYTWSTSDILTQITGDILEMYVTIDLNGLSTDIAIDYEITQNTDGNIINLNAIDTDGDGIIGGLIDTGPLAGFNLAFDLNVTIADMHTDAIVINDDQFAVVNDNPNLEYELLPSVSIQGDLESPYSEDFYQINLEANTSIAVDIDFLTNDTLIDSVVYLLDAEMNTVAFNDDDYFYENYYDDLDSYLEYTSATGGLYHIKVVSYVGFETGTYTLNIIKATNEITPSYSLIANDDTAITNDNTLVSIDILSNDIGVNGSLLNIDTISAPNGSITINADGTINYTPNANFIGTDVITYTISSLPQGDISHSIVENI